jgi:hypothetical protein
MPQSLPPASDPTTRRVRILALARSLSAELAELSLDTIDGEFFWRCCRAEIAETFEARQVSIPRPVLGTGPGAFHRFWEARRVHANRLHAIWDEHPDLILMIPLPVQECLIAGERVPMRPPEVQKTRGRPGDRFLAGESLISVYVRSGTWVGRDVEDAIARAVAEKPRLATESFSNGGEAAPDDGEASSVAICIAFSLHGDLTYAGENSPFWGPADFPFVEVEVPIPLPPAGAIAREYDAVVRDLKAWHLELPGGIPTRQENEVAVRTWAVGLLMAEGRRFGDAQRDVCGDGILPDVSQSRFGEDRRRLLIRVPEARPYLQG